MSKIDRMSIQGIRSFGPKDPETIIFNAPLTLIVGWNGSGKTTIIEALKYATTGELPPNSKTNGAFIHDPTLCNEREMLAQVKLSFRSTSGVRMIATRNLQCTLKKAARSQKTLDGSLLMVKDGERHSISTRVAELNQVIPQYLGVSTAILENVIFCHQEESLWPLSEPAHLKKKFDEIFEAQKYTKAIDNIRSIRKNQMTELGKLKIIEANNEQDKKRAKENTKKRDALFNEINGMREEWVKIGEQCAEAKEKASESYSNAARFEQIVAQLNAKRITFNANQESVATLEDNLTHMAESDDELQDMLDQYEERVAMYAEKNQDLRQQYRGLQENIESGRTSLGVTQSELGKYEAQKEHYDRQVQQREVLIKETANRQGIRGFDYDITENKAADFQQLLGKMSRDQNRALDRAREEAQQNLHKAQSELNALNTRKSNLAQTKDAARAQLLSNDKRIAEIHKKMAVIQADEGGEAVLQEKKKDVEKRLEQARSTASAEQLDPRISETAARVRVLEDQNERLTSELGEATTQARESASIDVKKDDLRKQEHSLSTVTKVHTNRISELVDSNWEPANLDAAFQQALSERTQKLDEAKSRRDVTQSKLSEINFKNNELESQLKHSHEELSECETEVKDALRAEDISDYDETLQRLEDDYDAASSDKAKFEAQMQYMTKCLEAAEHDNVCRLCMRSLHDNKAEDFTTAGFISKLKDIVKRAKANTDADNAEEIFADLEAARNAKPSYDTAIRLREKGIPEIQSKLAAITAERDSVNKTLEQQDELVYDLTTAKQEVESMAKDVQTIVSYYNKATELRAQIEELSKKQTSGGHARDIGSIQVELKKAGEDVRNARSDLEQLTAARDKSRTLINTLEISIRDVNAELNNAQSMLKEKKAFSDRVDELKKENSTQRDTIRESESNIESLVPEIEQAECQVDDIGRRGNERVQRAQGEASALSDNIRQLEQAGREIKAYEDRGGVTQLAEAQAKIQSIQEEIARVEKETMKVTHEVKKIEETMRSTELTKRSISDNLRYRKAKRSLGTLRTEIEALEGHGAERDKRHHEEEAENWDAQYHYLNTEATSKEREMKFKDDQLNELNKEWDEYYKDAIAKYRESHIKVETTKAAIEDLARYGGALDKAIMRYHEIKMAEINKTIKEIWTKAYQGTDVDSIRIASDSDGKGNKAFHYRVVMHKEDTEMDMRGRCSAGQKVLACIVIRLALAECFGTNCGLIALDEPTTNLDQQNIKGLAESLSEIIKIRKKQANFQLLVITHDEHFLREMNCADYTDIYWRVGRDPQDPQRAIIERQNISEVS